MRQVLILAGLALAAVLAACADEVRAPGPRATLEPAATATPDEPEARRTGIAELDAVLDVLFSGDEDAVRAMVRFTAIPCEAEPAGLGSPPKCHPNEPDGSSVDIFLEAYCEGTYVRPEDMARAYVMLATTGARLYAVYRARDTYWPAAQFVAIYTDTGVETSPGDAYGVSIADGRIVGTNKGCGDSPEEFIEGRRLGDAVLYTAPEGFTGIWNLDIVLDALRLADVETLDQLIRFQSIRCIATPQGIGAPPLCRPDEPDGTILAVLPVSTCELEYVRKDESDWVPGSLAEGQLYAVYQDGDRYVAVLSYEVPDGQRASRVFIEGRRIVEIDVTCVLTPEEALAGIDPADILVTPTAPQPPKVRHTGIVEVDAIIDAAGAGDENALRDLIQFESIACVGPTPGNLGGPPLCLDDETPGDIVAVLRGVGCHGDYGRVSVILKSIANLPHGVYAVIRESEGYHIVYSLPPRQSGEDSVGAGLRVQNGRIIALTNRCAQPAEAFVDGVAPEDFVLPPLP